MQILHHRLFHRARLPGEDRKRCNRAIAQFSENPFHPALNYERLGSGRHQNHCSIRASRELRVILAVEPEFQTPERVALVNMGHHDPMYRWSEEQGYRTNVEDAVELGGAGESLAGVLEATQDFDEWQLFLHPEQAALVKHQYAAEARIRGAAGTGKTVVALHRANEIGHRYAGERVLFTTFSRSLTEHLRRLYSRLPNSAKNVEFENIDLVARRIAGRPRVEMRDVNDAFHRAYRTVVSGTSLERCSPDYLRDEVDKVIKGRAASREEYLDTDRFERLGRRRRLNRADRELCWKLREEWDRHMGSAGTTEFASVLITARNFARRACPSYRSVIVDEAQDMTLTGMQLVRALVAGAPGNPVPPDGLLLLDDAAQRIYAGGFRLRWAGLEVGGRSEVLQTNYRNTRQIVDAARAVRGDTLPVREDNDDGAALNSRFECGDGSLPAFVRVGSAGEAPEVKERIRELVEVCGVAHESIGVLTRGNDHATRIADWLQRQGVACALLRAMRDRPLGDGVRVGTFDRSKGMEFEAVIIPRLGASVFPKAEDAPEGDNGRGQGAIPGIEDARREVDGEEREARQLDLDRLYVGMTRARKRLYLIADEAPCPEIERARELDLLDWQRKA